MTKQPFAKTRARNIATGVKSAGVAGGYGRLIRNGVGFVIVSLLMLKLMSWGIPSWFCLLVICMMAALVLLEVISIRRTLRVNLEELNVPVPDYLSLEPGEEPVLWIPGVMRAWKTRSYAVLGTGKVLTPDNTLLLTDRSIWALTVPLPGVDKVVSGTDIGKWQWLTAWQDIDDKLQQMLSEASLSNLLQDCRGKRICTLKEITGISYSELTQSVKIKLQGKESYTYSIRDKKIFSRIRRSLPPKG